MGNKQPRIDLRDYLAEQLQEMLSDENRYFAAQSLGREPTDEECVRHYIEHGGSKDFAKRHGLS